MITPLRRRHRWMAPAAFAVALASLAAGITFRPTAHARAMRVAQADDSTEDGGRVVLEFPDGRRFEVQLVATDTGDGNEGVRTYRFDPRPGDGAALDAPDLLLYGAADRGTADAFPAGATLLAPASTSEPTTFNGAPGVGAIVLYSLGHGRVVGVLDAPRAPEGR